MRRNLKRKEDYLKRKEAEERENSTDMEPSSQVKKTFKCSQCDNDFKSEKGLKIHIGKANKSSDPSTEKLRDAIVPALKPLVLSPIRETRIIHCNPSLKSGCIVFLVLSFLVLYLLVLLLFEVFGGCALQPLS